MKYTLITGASRGIGRAVALRVTCTARPQVLCAAVHGGIFFSTSEP